MAPLPVGRLVPITPPNRALPKLPYLFVRRGPMYSKPANGLSAPPVCPVSIITGKLAADVALKSLARNKPCPLNCYLAYLALRSAVFYSVAFLPCPYGVQGRSGKRTFPSSYLRATRRGTLPNLLNDLLNQTVSPLEIILRRRRFYG